MFEFEVGQLVILSIAILIAGVSKSGFAGGLGIICVPILSLVMGPLNAVALMLPSLLLMDYLSVRAWWGTYSASLLSLVLPAGIIGVVVGSLTFSAVDESAVKLVVGCMSLLFGVNGLARPFFRTSFSATSGRILGMVSGFTSFIAHAGGPPINIFLLSQSINKYVYLGTAAVFFAVINLVKVPPYISAGLFTLENVWVALAFSPISLAGIKLGVWLQGRINESFFFVLMHIFLILVGCFLIVTV